MENFWESRYSSREHGFTCHSQIWWKSDVGKLLTEKLLRGMHAIIWCWHMPYSRVSFSDLEWPSEIFSDTKYRAACQRQLRFLSRWVPVWIACWDSIEFPETRSKNSGKLTSPIMTIYHFCAILCCRLCLVAWC